MHPYVVRIHGCFCFLKLGGFVAPKIHLAYYMVQNNLEPSMIYLQAT